MFSGDAMAMQEKQHVFLFPEPISFKCLQYQFLQFLRSPVARDAALCH